MATRKAKPAIRRGRVHKPTRSNYPWDSLKKPGNWFKVKNTKKYGSLRAQASKQGKSRGVKYSVSLQKDGVLVAYEGPVLDGIEVHAG